MKDDKFNLEKHFEKINSESARDEKPKVSFVPKNPVWKRGDIVLPDAVCKQFDKLLSRVRHYKKLYEEWGLNEINPQGKHLAFNLYGQPGTGKTMSVHAIAAELGKKIISVNYAEIESKYVGETGQNITEAFKTARETGALLFFDEADSILGKRMTDVTQAADHAVNSTRAVMLTQLDEFDGVVAFATNLIENFDTAFERRIAQHIEIPLPDENGRGEIFQKKIPRKVPGRDGVDFDRLARESAGFGGGHILNAVLNSLARWVEITGKTDEMPNDGGTNLTDIISQEIILV
ncbi:MAG: AAA family ATPase, partial [Kiritimatiellaeota bacterium]|nr:AAA family ATPase [Kiritimatiellota bacterium]